MHSRPCPRVAPRWHGAPWKSRGDARSSDFLLRVSSISVDMTRGDVSLSHSLQVARKASYDYTWLSAPTAESYTHRPSLWQRIARGAYPPKAISNVMAMDWVLTKVPRHPRSLPLVIAIFHCCCCGRFPPKSRNRSLRVSSSDPPWRELSKTLK